MAFFDCSLPSFSLSLPLHQSSIRAGKASRCDSRWLNLLAPHLLSVSILNTTRAYAKSPAGVAVGVPLAVIAAADKKLGRPEIPSYLIQKIEHLAQTTDLSINKIRAEIENKVSRAAVGQIVKKVRDNQV